MPFYDQEELEKVNTLSKADIEQCFIKLNRLIIHCKGDEARDYCNQLCIVIMNTMDKMVVPAPISVPIVDDIVEPEPVVTVTKVETPKPEQFKVETFFAWSLHPEVCYFCRKSIPARKTGCGIFADHRMMHKWCEDCATEEHKNHPNYLKYKR